MSPHITAPKPWPRSRRKVASPRLENSWTGPESSTEGVKPFKLPGTTNPRPSSLLCWDTSLIFPFAQIPLSYGSSPAASQIHP